MSCSNDECQTRTYSLVSKTARELYDLRLYQNIIIDVVQSVIPNVKVTVEKDSYTVYGIRRGEAVQIGRMLSQYFGEAAVVKAVIFRSSIGTIFEEDKPFCQ